MSAESTLLGNVKVIIKINHIVWTGFHAQLVSTAFLGVDDHDAIIPFINSFLQACCNARSLITMLADIVEI